VQDAFANAVATRHRYRSDCPLEAWLWRAVVRTALNRRRSSARKPTGAPLEDAADADEVALDDPSLRAALEELSDRQRSVVFLRYYADLDYSAIGRILGIRRGTVGALLHAAHRSLRRSISEVAS
jgi:RNA polymerase sigma factor (sigma-70 family)